MLFDIIKPKMDYNYSFKVQYEIYMMIRKKFFLVSINCVAQQKRFTASHVNFSYYTLCLQFLQFLQQCHDLVPFCMVINLCKIKKLSLNLDFGDRVK